MGSVITGLTSGLSGILGGVQANDAGKAAQQLAQTTANTASNQEASQTAAALQQLQGIIGGQSAAPGVTAPIMGSPNQGAAAGVGGVFSPGATAPITQMAPTASIGSSAAGTPAQAAPAAQTAAAQPAAAGAAAASGAPTYGGLKWSPFTTNQGTPGYTASAGDGKTYYTGSDGKLYLDSYGGEVHGGGDVGKNLVGNASSYNYGSSAAPTGAATPNGASVRATPITRFPGTAAQ